MGDGKQALRGHGGAGGNHRKLEREICGGAGWGAADRWGQVTATSQPADSFL